LCVYRSDPICISLFSELITQDTSTHNINLIKFYVCLKYLSIWQILKAISIVTKLRGGRPGFDSRHGREIAFSLSLPRSDWLCGPTSLLSSGYWGVFLRSVKLTIHDRLVPRLGMRGAITPHPHTSTWHRDIFTFYREGYLSL